MVSLYISPKQLIFLSIWKQTNEVTLGRIPSGNSAPVASSGKRPKKEPTSASNKWQSEKLAFPNLCLTVAFQRHLPLPAWVLMHPDALGTAWHTMIDSHRLHVCMTDLWNVLKPSSSNSLQARRIWTCMSALIPQIPAPIETETKEFLQQSKFHCIWLSEDLHSSMPIYTLQVVRLCARHEEMQHLCGKLELAPCCYK